MREGPVDIPDPHQRPANAPPPQPAAPAVHNPGHYFGLTPDEARLRAPSQRVTVANTDQVQTHVIRDRFLQFIELKPGQRKEVEMLVDEIAAYRELARPNRGLYPSGPKMGQPLPQHPVRILDIPEAPPKENR